MKDLTKLLEEIEARADKAASARSDDFGHNTQDLLLWESGQLAQFAETDIPRLIAALRVTLEALDEISYWGLDPTSTAIAGTSDKATAQAAKILAGEL